MLDGQMKGVLKPWAMADEWKIESWVRTNEGSTEPWARAVVSTETLS